MTNFHCLLLHVPMPSKDNGVFNLLIHKQIEQRPLEAKPFGTLENKRIAAPDKVSFLVRFSR